MPVFWLLGSQHERPRGPQLESIGRFTRAILDGKLECEQHPLDFTIEVMQFLDEARKQINAPGC